MHNSFLNHAKKQFLPIGLVLFVVRLNVEKFLVFICLFALTRCKKFLTSQRVKNFIFNIGLGLFAFAPNPSKGAVFAPFLISKNSIIVNNF